MDKKYIKNKYFYLMLFFLVTYLSILINTPFLRSISSVVFFLFVPGYVILDLMNERRLDNWERFILSLGLSLSFLMFIGFLLNQLYGLIGITNWLSKDFLAFSFGTFIFIALISQYLKYYPIDLHFNISNAKIYKHKYSLTFLFPVIFPCLAVVGTYFMNNYNINILLIINFILIALYMIVVTRFRNEISKNTYPFAILFISAALVLMYDLTSDYLIGSDVHREFFAFEVVSTNMHWSISDYPNVLTACLSVSLLPAILKGLSGINDIYIYKVILSLIWAFTPLICYIIFKNFVKEIYAFWATFFFISQYLFISPSQNGMRTLIAIFFLALTLLVLFDEETKIINKKLLLLIFAFSIIVSHYTTSYIFLALQVMVWTSLFLLKKTRLKIVSPSKSLINPYFSFIFFILLYIWYGRVTVGFDDLITFSEISLKSLANIFVAESREQSLYLSLTGSLVGANSELELLAHRISLISTYTLFIAIFLGASDSLFQYFKGRRLFKIDYLLMSFFCGCIVAAEIIVPFLSVIYGPRAYLQASVLLALSGFKGIEFVCKYVKKSELILPLLVTLVLSQYFCAAAFNYQIADVPSSVVLNRDGREYELGYIYQQDVTSAYWLTHNYDNNSIINSDISGPQSFYHIYHNQAINVSSEAFQNINIKYFSTNKRSKGYIYLRYINNIRDVIYPGTYAKNEKMSAFHNLLNNTESIYNNGGSTILLI